MHTPDPVRVPAIRRYRRLRAVPPCPSCLRPVRPRSANALAGWVIWLALGATACQTGVADLEPAPASRAQSPASLTGTPVSQVSRTPDGAPVGRAASSDAPSWVGRTDFGANRWADYVARHNETALEDNVLYALHSCKVEDGCTIGLRLHVQSAAPLAGQPGLVADCTTDPTSRDCISLAVQQMPYLDKSQWAEFIAEPLKDSKGANLSQFKPEDCRFEVSIGSEDCSSNVITWEDFSSFTFLKNKYYPGLLPYIPTTGECDGSVTANTTSPELTGQHAEDILSCMCPTNSSVCQQNRFNFFVAFFHRQAHYRFDIYCGSYHGAQDLFIADNDHCTNTAMQKVFFGENRSGYYPSTYTENNDQSFLGNACPATPIQWGKNGQCASSFASLPDDSASTARDAEPNTPSWTTPAPAPARSPGEGAGLSADSSQTGNDLSAKLAFLRGEHAGDQTGSATAAGFDFNGDGFGDFLVGAPDWNNASSAAQDAGAAYLVFGGPDRFASSMPLAGANLGVKVNGSNLQIRGTTSGRAILELKGQNAFGYAGTSLAAAHFASSYTASSVGYDLLAVGQPDHDQSESGIDVDERAGSVFLLFGNQSGNAFPFGEQALNVCTLRAQGIRAVELRSDFKGGLFGKALSAGADLDGDHLPELVVGAPQENGEGWVYLFSGRDLDQLYSRSAAACSNPDEVVVHLSELAQTRTFTPFTTSGVSSNYLGDGALVVPDFITRNGLALPALVIDARKALIGGEARGALLVWQGGPLSQLNVTAPTGIIQGDQTEALFESHLSSLPDVNGDGLSELVLGAPYHDVSSATGALDRAGAVYLIFGRDAGSPTSFTLPTPSVTTSGLETSHLHLLAGTVAGGQLGYSIDAAPGVSGTGDPEPWLVLGEPYYPTPGGLWGRALWLAFSPVDPVPDGEDRPWETASSWAAWDEIRVSDSWGLGQHVALLGDVDQDLATRASELLVSGQGSYANYLVEGTDSDLGPDQLYLYWGEPAF